MTDSAQISRYDAAVAFIEQVLERTNLQWRAALAVGRPVALRRMARDSVRATSDAAERTDDDWFRILDTAGRAGAHSARGVAEDLQDELVEMDAMMFAECAVVAIMARDLIEDSQFRYLTEPMVVAGILFNAAPATSSVHPEGV